MDLEHAFSLLFTLIRLVTLLLAASAKRKGGHRLLRGTRR